jgi:hypothetical protein
MSTAIAPRTAPGKSSGSPWLRGGLALAALALVGITGTVFTVIIGRVSGEEFAPSHFQSREFEYLELPYLRWQLTGVTRSSTTPSIVRYLVSQQLINCPPGDPPQWQLARVSNGPYSDQTDVEMLLTILRGTGGPGDDWEAWSVAHPAIAKLLWPRVQSLAQQDLFVLLPTVFKLALQSENGPAFQTSLDRYLSDSYAEMIDDWRAAGRPELVAQLLATARLEYPQDPRFTP